MATIYDTIIIGGGFYGLRVAQYMREELGQQKVLVIEKERELMSRASFNNQARAHNGYHYPRSVLTALRSRVNLPIFVNDFREAIDLNIENYYAVARSLSKVSARQFERFFHTIGAEVSNAPEAKALFDLDMIEDVFRVKEYTFNATLIREILTKRLNDAHVDVHTEEKATKIQKSVNCLEVTTDKSIYRAKNVINTTYSSINEINNQSDLPTFPLKHEVTEMCLVNVPSELEGKAITVMCGPFFSLMPFPSKGVYTLSHVRYTPHSEWFDDDKGYWNGHQYLRELNKKSRFAEMYADIKRYMPLAKNINYTGESLWEIKTVLPQSEADDSRPILYKSNYGGIKNYTCIMGGKIDNIYDVFRELRFSYESS